MNAHLIYNPVAGPWDARVPLDRIRASLKSHGWRVQLHVTERAGDATGFAREAARAGDDLVLVAGGDGTVNEALNGLVGSETALGVLPVGTGNSLARELGPGKTIVTVLCDYGNRYQSKLFNPTFLQTRGLPVPGWLEARNDSDWRSVVEPEPQ